MPTLTCGGCRGADDYQGLRDEPQVWDNEYLVDLDHPKWGKQTFIAGLRAEGMIAPWVIKGAMDGPAFAAYVEKVLVPELSPGSVVILDNLAVL